MSEAAITIDSLTGEAEEAEGIDIFTVDTSVFEGPLHLLLELARRQKVDLMKVSIATLAEQYLVFIREAKARRIDLAADYLLMAAWLAYLKSRLLLPKPEKDQDQDETSADMAQRLAFRLKRLEGMRQAVRDLTAGPILGERVFLRGLPEQPRVVKTVEYDTTLWHLTQAFGAMRSRKQKAAPHRIEKQFVLPLESAREGLRILRTQLVDWESLDTVGRRIGRADPGVPVRSVKASVFSAALELARDGDVELRQEGHFTPLYLRAPAPKHVEIADEPA